MRAMALSGVLVLAAAFLILAPADAQAAHRCDAITIGRGSRVRVATVLTSCVAGRGVATRFFALAREEAPVDGHDRFRGAYYAIEGFRCFSGLAATQMFCIERDRRVYASSRPGDHPASWS